MQTLVFITSLTFIPAILLMMTSFTRIIIVFGLLRNALGTPSAPPNQVLLGLALFLTLFYYVAGDRQNLCRCVPAIQRRENINAGGAGKRAQPLREFMLFRSKTLSDQLPDLVSFSRLSRTDPEAALSFLPGAPIMTVKHSLKTNLIGRLVLLNESIQEACADVRQRDDIPPLPSQL
ncbi:hypothetical protein KZ773_02145 [Escherichia coli]|nr:hypothetical protein [Escherichia coli]